MALIKRQIEHERRIDAMMRRGIVEWRVEKQVIVVPPPEEDRSGGAIASRALVRHGEYQFIDFDCPRLIRITISNNTMVILIGEVPLGAQHEAHFNHLVAAAEDQASFLNAHDIR